MFLLGSPHYHQIRYILGHKSKGSSVNISFERLSFVSNLATTKHSNSEIVEDYLNRFWQIKSRCYTQIPEHELVRMMAAGLDFSIRKKLVNQ